MSSSGATATGAVAASPGTELQLAHVMIEHLMQVLVDLLVGRGDLAAELASRAG